MPEGVQTQVASPQPGGQPLAPGGNVSDPIPPVTPAGVVAGTVTPNPNGGATQVLPDGRVQILSPNAYKRIKEEARERGKREVFGELNDRAKALGFKSHEDMLLAAAASRSSNGNQSRQTNGNGNTGGQNAQPQGNANVQPPPPKGSKERNPKAWAHFDKQLEQSRLKLAEQDKRIAEENRKRRKATQRADALEAEMQLREAILRGGGRDVKYLTHLLREELQGKGEDELKSFDENDWLKKKREESPYLFGETIVRATTGTGVSGAPPPPTPGQVQANQNNQGRTDARSMSTADFEKLLASRGLQR